jgi:hypothetical protein
MKSITSPGRSSISCVVPACVAAALIPVVYFATTWSQERIPISKPSPGIEFVTVPVVQLPPTVTGRDARVRDETEVIGVSVADRHRAYVLDALEPLPRHVINDLLDGVPCTVSYCNVTDCVRVLTAPGAKEPLAIAVGGWDSRSAEGVMLLRVGSDYYRQDSGLPLAEAEVARFPYVDLEFERTTWGNWREAHPHSDVYVGH